MPSIHWFRRDLRLHDNAAFAAAAQHDNGVVVPLFMLDDALLRSPRMSAARVRFLLDSLRALDTALRQRGSCLVVRHGQPAAVLAAVLDESAADAVFFNRDYTPFARQRDAAVGAMLEQRGVAAHSFPDVVMWEPDALLTKKGTPSTMYAPYQRQWRARTEAVRNDLFTVPPLPTLTAVPHAVEVPPIPDAAALGYGAGQPVLPGGEHAGLERLTTFVQPANENGIAAYATQRDLVACAATSQLSPYLHFGCVATRACVRAAFTAYDSASTDAQTGIDRWLGELAWHDFYVQIMFHFPHVLKGAFKPAMNALEWDNDTNQFAAWCAGQTGYPIVDAAMRHLNRDGWIPNRARLIVASFLVKDLLIDWRWGETYFLQQLVDGDLAANNGGWQWIASSGTDAQPFFRMLSPISQSAKADPDGAYIRRYVPELAALPTRYLHAPWQTPATVLKAANIRLGRDYPTPIVDHATQRARTLAMYRRVATAQKDTE